MDPLTIARTVIEQIEDAWNAADGAAYGEAFTDDASFVDIRGELHTGEEIGAGHQQIFDTIYAGSTVSYDVFQARPIEDGVLVAQIRATLNVPGGPFAGEHHALATVVLVPNGDGHGIAAFHNTLVSANPIGGRPSA